MASSEKRCLYEVLGLPIDCAADEIRTAYRKMALQRHPDKLVQSGLSHAEATASFQELVNAYEVLSDPKERAWYDSHRSQILFSDPVSSSNSVIPDLFSYFSNSVFSGYADTNKGFYNVYSSVFDKIYANELNFAKKIGGGLLDCVKEAPVMGNLDSPYAQATAFYNYWLGFVTVMDFCWVDQYDAMAGPNRKSRRLMEDENKKLRKKAKREYNETVRGLAEFVKKRDKRVIDMQVKKGLEMEKKRELEKERKKELEKEKLQRAMAYEEPEWARVDNENESFHEEVGEEFDEGERRNELYCVVCGKKFKSEKQWKNHEQSKKHKEKVAGLRGAFNGELKEKARSDKVSSSDTEEDSAVQDLGTINDSSHIDELDDQFQDSCGIEDVAESSDGGIEDVAESSDGGPYDTNNGFDQNVNDMSKVSMSRGLDDEMIDLESMLAGRKNRKKTAAAGQPRTENQTDGEEGFMEYDNRKSTRKNKGSRRAKGKKEDADSTRADEADSNGRAEENNRANIVENESTSKEDLRAGIDHKRVNQVIDEKSNLKKDKDTKPESSKGRKSKGMSKSSANLCDACGEDFESKNKLHKHLGETGHASLKHR